MGPTQRGSDSQDCLIDVISSATSDAMCHSPFTIHHSPFTIAINGSLKVITEKIERKHEEGVSN
jgi:hypothetical protein